MSYTIDLYLSLLIVLLIYNSNTFQHLMFRENLSVSSVALCVGCVITKFITNQVYFRVLLSLKKNFKILKPIVMMIGYQLNPNKSVSLVLKLISSYN